MLSGMHNVIAAAHQQAITQSDLVFVALVLVVLLLLFWLIGAVRGRGPRV